MELSEESSEKEEALHFETKKVVIKLTKQTWTEVFPIERRKRLNEILGYIKN